MTKQAQYKFLKEMFVIDRPALEKTTMRQLAPPKFTSLDISFHLFLRPALFWNHKH